jgi:ATP-dependent DNA ligase
VAISELPVRPPVAPMLAKLARELPNGNYIYEPKWDGFRAIVFRSSDDFELTSRNDLSLTRYFPELVEVLKAQLPKSVVIDGEVVVTSPRGLNFGALCERLHPAASRVNLLAKKTPASFVAFDLLALGSRDLRSLPFAERRRALQEMFAGIPLSSGPPSAHLTPATRDQRVARDWFARFEGAGLDGVIAKPANLAYLEGKRAMVKVKHERTADFVVAGYRYYRGGDDMLGSLMLGLYDKHGRLVHVGVIGSFSAADRKALLEVVAPYRLSAGAGLEEHPWAHWAAVGNVAAQQAQRPPGARSRWNATKDLSSELLRPELVVEAAYEHLQGGRLRHTAQFRRWRPERPPQSCTYEQLEAAVPVELAEVFGTR